ncbi:CDGP domain-containing protein [Mycobacterium sp. HM-7]
MSTTSIEHHFRIARRVVGAALAVLVLAGIGIGYATDAKAAPSGIACQTVPWGVLFSQRRTLCDTPVHADGSWIRERTIWWPKRWVPVCGYYSCWGGYWQPEGGNRETYPVTPDTVLHDEPGHLGAVA